MASYCVISLRRRSRFSLKSSEALPPVFQLHFSSTSKLYPAEIAAMHMLACNK